MDFSAIRAEPASRAMSASTASTAPLAVMASRSGSTVSASRVGSPRRCLDERTACVVGPGEGVRDEHGALALAQVVAGGLARGGGVAEDPQQVVAQLERLTQVEPVAGQGGEVLVAGATGGRADEQGVLDGVLGALEPDHVFGALDPLAASDTPSQERADSTTSRNCPPMSWVRIRSKTARPRARWSGRRPEVA